MVPPRLSWPNNGYLELASAQLLDDRWLELNFDLASGQSVLQDLVMPESGGGYVYREAHQTGSATQNRFIYWRTTNDILELVEISTEVVLDGNQVRIRFANSPIINNVNVIEFYDSIVIMVATSTSVHRLYLPHPKTTDKSVLHELTTDVLFDPSNFYILSNHGALNNQQPICAASWYDRSALKCALSFPDSSLLIVQFSKDSHHINTVDIKQTGIIGRIWSKMPNLLAKNPNDCLNAVFVCIPYNHQETHDILLFTLCRDWKIRVFSTNTRECVATYNIFSQQNSFSQSLTSHTNPATDQPMMKMFGSRMIVYITENQSEFVIMSHYFEDDIHKLREESIVVTPSWEKLVDFSMTETKIWALANMRETESMLCYLDIENIIDRTEQEEETDAVWDFVNLIDDLDMPSLKNYVTEIFWRNHFSHTIIQKALTGVAGLSIPPSKDMKTLEELAFTRIVDDDQDEAWKRFYNYCLQNHHVANKNIGLVTADDETVVSVIKRSNPSFVCPWIMNLDMIAQGGPYRGVEFSSSMQSILEPLNYISCELMDDEISRTFEEKLFESPAIILGYIDEMTRSLAKSKKITVSSLNFNHKNLLSNGIDYICEKLDLTAEAKDFGLKIMQQSCSSLRSEHNPLESNIGIMITFESFKRLVRARMILARDLLIYIHLMVVFSESEKGTSTEKFLFDLCQQLFTSSKTRLLADSLRSYATLVWIAESFIKTLKTSWRQLPSSHSEVISFISDRFRFFKNPPKTYEISQDSTLELVIHQNLFMNFMINGGVKLSSQNDELSELPQTLSNSFYVTEIALNLCRLLWPKSGHICFAEFLFTHALDEHLNKFLDLTQDWLNVCEYDMHFMRASNYILQGRVTQAVDVYNRLWMNMTYSNLLGRFIDLDKEKPSLAVGDTVSVNPALIYRYYDKLIQLFQIFNNYQCLVMLINQCMSLLDGNADAEQQHWVNCFRAKLFQYYLELEDPDEAYHTMVLTTDSSLRINCLRKFIVSHCENEQWSNLLSYPFIDIKGDFIDILSQKAESSDLSKLSGSDFYKTSYYDLLFASYVSDNEFKRAAGVMHNYAQRLAHEVPGIISIRKQADCLLIALNTLKCVHTKEAFVESNSTYNKTSEDGRTSVLKRAYDCESEFSTHKHNDELTIQAITPRLSCKEIVMKYELTRARLRLLEKDQTANAIALSPLRAEEIIAQLVASSMCSTAIDLALLFKAPMDPILEGLTAKYIFIMRLSTVDIAMHQDLERSLTDIFTSTYSNIDTYNYVANSTSSFVEKLWRLIDYYLVSYDGVSHRYSTNAFSDTFAGTTVLMRIVASKLLSAGYYIPASLRRLYMTRYSPELLKLLIKYDKLDEAAELAIEMLDRVLEPSNCFAFTTPFATNDPPPIYLPTHLILLLVSFLQEDATDTHNIKTGEILMDRLNKFRRFVKSAS